MMMDDRNKVGTSELQGYVINLHYLSSAIIRWLFPAKPAGVAVDIRDL